MRIKIFLLLSFFIFSPLAAVAASTASVAPQLNPICWSKDECLATRLQFLNIDGASLSTGEKEKLSNEGWFPNEAPCNSPEWGKCLPAGTSKTEISFGGKTEFANVGVFLQYIYKYAIIVAGILAVVVIILAGLQYITSGGNSETISSAKKRIGGAIVGLFIAYASYSILGAVNPALVNLRLPQTWMMRPQVLSGAFCDGLTDKLAYAGILKDSFKPFTSLTSANFFIDAAWYDNLIKTDVNYQTDATKLAGQLGKEFGAAYQKNNLAGSLPYCGNYYYPQKGAGSVCMGTFCAPKFENNEYLRQVCTPNESELYECKSGVILSGEIRGVESSWEYPWFDSDGGVKGMQLGVACKNGNYYEIAGSKVVGINVNFTNRKLELKNYKDTQKQEYSFKMDFKYLDELAKKCNNDEGLKGYFIAGRLNGNSTQFSETRIIGKSNKNECNFIITRNVPGIILGQPEFKATLKKVDPSNLISQEELERGYICNIFVTDLF